MTTNHQQAVAWLTALAEGAEPWGIPFLDRDFARFQRFKTLTLDDPPP